MAPTWETATDWDSGQSETGTHHEQPTGTDWAPSGQVEKGYPTTDPGGSALEGYWPCDEDSGSVFADVSAAGNDLSLTGATPGAPGINGTTCGSYDGTDDYGEAPSVVANTDAFTATFWLNHVSHDSYARVAQSGGGTSSTPTDGWSLEFDGGNNALRPRFWSGGSNSAVGTASVPTGWCFVAFGTNGGVSEGMIRIYQDGSLASSGTGSGTRTTATTGQPLLAMVGDSNYTEGSLDEIRVYSRELSDQELLDHHLAGL